MQVRQPCIITQPSWNDELGSRTTCMGRVCILSLRPACRNNYKKQRVPRPGAVRSAWRVCQIVQVPLSLSHSFLMLDTYKTRAREQKMLKLGRGRFRATSVRIRGRPSRRRRSFASSIYSTTLFNPIIYPCYDKFLYSTTGHDSVSLYILYSSKPFRLIFFAGITEALFPFFFLKYYIVYY